ncbi:MAG: zinc metallopeptidase [Bacteroidales bacterium]|nr:zinc metallopeptidase [Bacteroidales bacterium]
MGIWTFFILLTVISYIVSIQFQNKFKKYSMQSLPYPLSGKQIAEMMLADYAIHDVNIVPAHGYLSDHYNPANKTIALSPVVYSGNSIASVAVAAHETGHALQDHRKYFWVHVRSGLVPLAQLGAQISTWALLGGMFLLNAAPWLLLLGIIGYGISVLFSFVTLPVEFDASRRALEWMKQKGIVGGQDYEKAKDALKWAAMTYVVGALTALATLAYYIFLFMGVSSDD